MNVYYLDSTSDRQMRRMVSGQRHHAPGLLTHREAMTVVPMQRPCPLICGLDVLSP